MFEVKETLTDREIDYGLHAVMMDGVTSQAMSTFIGGVILVDFALQLGASNFLIGLIAAIPFLAQLIQIPSIYLVEKVGARRKMTVVTAAVGRLFLLFIALIPFIISDKWRVKFLLFAMLLYASFGAMSACGWNSWLRDLIPRARLGAFFSKRLTAMTAMGAVLSLLAGVYLNWWKNSFVDEIPYGFSILYFLGFLSGEIGVYIISTIPEPRMYLSEKKESFFKALCKPCRAANFKNLLMFMGSWNFAVNLAAPFFAVYMLKRLEMNIAYVIGLGVLSQIINMIFFRIWGKLSDRFSFKSVLAVSGPMLILCIFTFTFTTLPEKYVLTIPLLIIIHVLMGISTAGVTLASGTIGLKLAPKGQATSFLATLSLVNSLAAGIAPIIGGFFADYFTNRELSLTLQWHSPNTDFAVDALNFQQWDFFFFLAFLIGLYSIHRLALVKEDGEVKERIIINELFAEARRVMRNVSTVGGIRYMIQFPFALIGTRIINRRRKAIVIKGSDTRS